MTGLAGAVKSFPFVALAAARQIRNGSFPATGILTKISLAIIVLLSSCVLGLAVYGPPVTFEAATQPAPELHPTCSPEHDCWIAAPESQQRRSALDQPGDVSPDSRKGDAAAA